MYLKREPPKSLPKPLLLKNCFSTRERPARTPPSTFLFLPIHFSNSPEIMAISTPPVSRRAVEARASEYNRIPFTVPVRSFRGAQSRCKRKARRWPVYRLRLITLSTANSLSFRTSDHQDSPVSPAFPTLRQSQVLIMIAPHSGHIPR